MLKFKSLITYLSLALCISCTDTIEDFKNDNPFEDDKQNQEENWNKGTGVQEETEPTSSDVTVEDESDTEDNADSTQFDAIVSIIYSNSDVSVSGTPDDVEVQKNGTRITVSNTGDKKIKYILSGSCSDGFFKLYSSKKQALQLNDLTLSNTKGAAINNQSGKRTFFIIEGDNSISDGAVNSSGEYPEETDDEDMKAAIFSEGQLIFSGSGTLNVSAVGKAGITSDDYIRFMTGSDVTVTSAKGHGIRGKDAIIVTGGDVNVTLESTATGKKCFTSDSLIYISGGKTTLINKASAGTVDSEITGAAGIKADYEFVMKGGELSINTSGKGCKCINCDGNGFFEGGTAVLKSTGSNYGSNTQNSVSSKAIKCDGNLEFSASDVTAYSAAHEAIESKGTIYISGGRISASSSDDAINSASTMTISDGIVYAYSTGNDGLDANGDLYIKGGTIYAIGCGAPEVAIDANTEQNYRLYINAGNVIAIGGIESSSSVSQASVSTSWSRNTNYTLCDGDTVLYSFKTPASGGTTLFMTSASLTSGNSYTLLSAATLSGEESYFDGVLSTGGTASGGKSTSVTASNNSGGGNTPGGGNNPGGPGGNHGPGGWF